MILWIFNTIEESKQFLNSKTHSIWDRIIILWSSQSTFEWNWKERKNINWIFIEWKPWEPWKSIQWKPWENWKPWKDAIIDIPNIVNYLFEKIQSSETFQKKIQWEPWKPWKDGEHAIYDSNNIANMVVNKLLNDPIFIQKCKWKDWYTPVKWKDYFDWKDWYTPVKWKDYFDWIWIDWADWLKLRMVDIDWMDIWENELWISFDKTFYVKHNNTIIKI